MEGQTNPDHIFMQTSTQVAKIDLRQYHRKMSLEDPYQLLSPTFGHCPLRGLNACPDGLGHLLREELSKFKRASAGFGGIVIQYYLKFPLPPIVAGLSPSNLKDREVQHKKQQ